MREARLRYTKSLWFPGTICGVSVIIRHGAGGRQRGAIAWELLGAGIAVTAASIKFAPEGAQSRLVDLGRTE